MLVSCRERLDLRLCQIADGYLVPGLGQEHHLDVVMDEVPGAGEWPVEPQEEERVKEDRIWIDGCFDFFHHGALAVAAPNERRTTLHRLAVTKASQRSRRCHAPGTPARH